MKDWIHAFRLRTLPLALSSIAMGGFLAAFFNAFQWSVTLLAALTTLFLQILSNLANDYGDAQKGTDNAERIGPERAIQSGRITLKQMRWAIGIFVFLSLLSGIALIILATHQMYFWVGILFLALGLLAIAAAILYTVGKKAYGYNGLGDIFVFIFFGLLAVVGTYFLNAQHLRWDILFPAASLGFFSTGVLNLNNLRDIENDKASKKITLAVRLGEKSARYYHIGLISLGLLLAIVFDGLNLKSFWVFSWVLPIIPLFVIDLRNIIKVKDLQKLDPYLKKLALKTLAFVFLFGLSLLLA